MNFFKHWMSYLVVFEYLAVFDLLVEKIDFYFVDFEGRKGLYKSKRTANKSYEFLSSSYTDLLIPAKLNFFSFFAIIFEPYLKVFQTDAPMVPFMWSNDLVVKALDSQSRGPVFKTTGWLQGQLSVSSFRAR